MPRYQAVWHGKRPVRATTLITAATAAEARAIAEQMDIGQLHFSNVDATYDQRPPRATPGRDRRATCCVSMLITCCWLVPSA